MTGHPAPLTVAPDVVARQLGDGAVLVHLPSSRIFELNETGARIWALLAGGVDPDDIRETLTREFEVDPEEAARDVDTLVGQLVREGLLVS